MYEERHKYVPAKRWTQARVAAVVDALVESEGTMSATAAAPDQAGHGVTEGAADKVAH